MITIVVATWLYGCDGEQSSLTYIPIFAPWLSVMANFIDRILGVAKWPVAITCGFLTWPALIILLKLLQVLRAEPLFAVGQLVAGVAGYCVAWWLLLRRTRVTFFSTLEHEIAHAIFAVATGHRVTGLRSSLRGGGRMTFQGTGNWLITISPYFFPTITVVVCLCAAIVPHAVADKAELLFGVSLGYHFVSTYRETHRNQSDLKKEGYLFCFLVLPFANLFVVGLCLAGFADGWHGVVGHVASLWTVIYGWL